MTKEELKTHIEKRYSECCKRSQGLSYGSFYDGYVDCYCEQQKRIEKLEQQIEKMKRCSICKYSTDLGYCKIRCNGGECNKMDKWEIKEK